MTLETHTDLHQFNWLLANFVRHTDGVRDAVAVSSDGLLIATSDGLTRN
jgi:predicted regulator of Ras-like GTPase activity (Roadblock/LC7/MglB family)